MRKVWRVMVAVALASLFGCAENNLTVPADQLPVEHLPPQVTPLMYNVELYLQTRKDEFTGHVEIDVDVHQAFDRLWLHGATLKVGTVQIVGATIATGEWRQHTPEGLASIVFDRTVPVGRSKIILDYSAPYSPGLKGFIRSRDKNTYLASLADGGARFMLPGFDEPRYRAPISLSIDIPAQLDAMASTDVINRTALENQRRVIRFAETLSVPLGAVGLVVTALESPQQVTSDHTVVRGYGLDPMPWLAGLDALELRSEFPYPFKKLDVIALPAVNDTVNVSGLIVNPEPEAPLQAERLAQHWWDHAGAYRSWQAQCVARGVAKWAGLDAYRNAGLLTQAALDEVWQQAQTIDAYPLGRMCWDVPSDKVLPLAEIEDHALIAGAILTIEDKLGKDVTAENLWRDWFVNRNEARSAQDFMPALYQRIYTVLQDGHLMPTGCTQDCRYVAQAAPPLWTVEQALQNVTQVSLAQWRAIQTDTAVKAFFESVVRQADKVSLSTLSAQLGEALPVAMGYAMGQDFDRWSAFLRQRSAEASSTSERLAALFALAESTDSRIELWFQQLFVNRALPPHESDALFARLMQSPQADGQLQWLAMNRDKIMRTLSPAQRVRWLDALGYLCGEPQATVVDDMMRAAAPLIFRGEARLERALSRIRDCNPQNL